MRFRPFASIENSLEFIVERPFALMFRRSVQPAEIGKRLKRELISGSIVTVRGKVAPNDFTVNINPADYQPYRDHGRALAEDLAAWLDEVVLASNLATLGVSRVRFEPDDSIRPGRFDVRAEVNENGPEPLQFSDPGSTEAFDVRQVRGGAPSGFIEICSGPSTGAIFAVRKHVVSIGRDLSNDLVIDSAEVSRFHAELQTSGPDVFLLDRQSMNGTFVNGIRIYGTQVIGTEDQLMFGSTICRYWRELL